ncbi:MAG TPA: M14 family zinc carboxypeptidase [Bacteroidales bacterium]|nr:M14 family zinc carboxypeptidase [Bacteroidales bacterium]HPI31566.1 M14 family zinc carboxypeptidase [Bacteroidales bacterium]HQN17398.1 M14 family zinc carboxypeptidase [Bacteroidales bacterium]
MCKKSLIVIILLTARICFGQEPEALSHVKVWCTDYRQLSDAGITVIHGQFAHKSYFDGVVSISDLNKLKLAGLPYELITENLTEHYQIRNKRPFTGEKNITYNCGLPNTYATPVYFGMGSMGGYYTYAEAIAQLDSMRTWFPNLVSAKAQIGLSIENRPIYAVKISDNPDINEGEKQVLYTSVHHSQEPCGLQQLIFFMYYLLENYNNNTEINYLLNNLEIYFVPVINPDGYVYNQSQNPTGGGSWRKNRRDNGLLSYGVDLNRNYGYQWGYNNIGSQPIGSSPWYRGTAAFSEPESQTMKTFIEAHDFLLDMNWHSYGNFLIYPWNYESLLTDDSTLFEEFSRYLTMESHYRYGTCDQTYGYNSNGDADDWGYGDTSAKSKIFSFTAEIGSADDGFWPAAADIETRCLTSLDMNLRFARLGTPFALVNDLSSTYISGTTVNIPVEVYCLGLDVPASFSVSITPLSSNIVSTGTPAGFTGMFTGEKRYDSIAITLSPAIAQGSEISFSLNITNGNYTWKDTITKIFCLPDTLFYDPANNLVNWTADDFALTAEDYSSFPSCFTESPSANYGLLQTSSLELVNNLDLSAASSAYLLFKAKWETEKSYDWAQVFASADNGSSWQPLCGRHSAYGTDDEEEGEPVYDGFSYGWVAEEIPLNAYLGGSLKIRFEFHSDQTTNFDGIYLDDITVLACNTTTTATAIENTVQTVIFPNPAQELLTINALAERKYTILATDIYGNVVIKTKSQANPGGKLQISTASLAPGTYFLQIISENDLMGNHKFVVIH